MLFNLDFANNTFNNDLYFLIPTIITQIFNPIAELVIPLGIRTKEEIAEMETHPVVVEIKINEWSI